MLTSLRLVDFKNFADETLKLGPFTIIVGANASGKSNIRDAFRVLHGMGREYSLPELLGGKHGASGQLEWGPIRGAMNEIIRLGANSATFGIGIAMNREGRNTNYSIKVGTNQNGSNEFRLQEEVLRSSTGPVYKLIDNAQADPWLTFGYDNGRRVKANDSQPVLLHALTRTSEWLKDELETAENRAEFRRIFDEKFKGIQFMIDVLRSLIMMQFLEFSPGALRSPSVPGATKLGESGDNLPTVLKTIYSDHKRRSVLTSWLRELTPMDVESFEFPIDPSGRIHLRLLEKNGRMISASSASDGTLRFLGILAALLGPNPADLYFLEEIDNGIHPSRLHLLIELIETETKRNGIQVVATTHSPDVLNLINDTTFGNASVVYRDEDSADAIIRPVAELPRVRELRESQGLGRLHAGGWMEDILSFEAADAEAIE